MDLFKFTGLFLTPMVVLHSYFYFQHKRKIDTAYNRLDYLEATDKCLEHIEKYREYIKESNTRGEKEANAELANRLYFNRLKYNICDPFYNKTVVELDRKSVV